MHSLESLCGNESRRSSNHCSAKLPLKYCSRKIERMLASLPSISERVVKFLCKVIPNNFDSDGHDWKSWLET
jgi:hypothetical protein